MRYAINPAWYSFSFHDVMNTRNIIVIGASAGGFEPIKTLVKELPTDLNAAIFITWHLSPDVKGILPSVLNNLMGLPAANAINDEEIKMGRIYVAPPDQHMVLLKGKIRLTRGPKENRFRPAIDPLFRSAAYYYGEQVIGIILSGALDDGTSGLWLIKKMGGLTIVQDPHESDTPSMPMNAIRAVDVDHVVPVGEMPLIISAATRQEINPVPALSPNEKHLLDLELNVALDQLDVAPRVYDFGSPSRFTCPECHGVLSEIKEGARLRYRCHTGHAFSDQGLLETISENIEKSLWCTIRGIEESVMLLNHVGDHLADNNQPKLAGAYFKKLKQASEQLQFMRRAVLAMNKSIPAKLK